MAYSEPDVAGLGADWLNQLGFGQYGGGYGGGYEPPSFSNSFGTNPGLGGMYAGAGPGYTAPDLGAMGASWLDQILGTGGGGGALGAGNMYLNPGGGAGAGGSFLDQGLGGLGSLYGTGGTGYNPALMSSYPPLQAYMAPQPSATALPAPSPYGTPGTSGASYGLAQATPGLGGGYSSAALTRAGQQSGYGSQGFGSGVGGFQSGSGGALPLGNYGQQQGSSALAASRGRSAQPGYGQTGTQGYGTQGYGQQAGYSPYTGGQTGQQYGYSGGATAAAPTATGTGQYALPVPSGGVYGAQKWSSSMGSNAVDIFVPRGTPVTAPDSGTLQMGQGGQLYLLGDHGLSFGFRHGVTTANGHVQKGQQIGYVSDPGMDSLGQPGFGQMPDGYQHLEFTVTQGNQFSPVPGGGGSIDAAQWLQSQGYQGQQMAKTPGPPDARGGGGMSMGMGGGGGLGGMFGGLGGLPGGGLGGYGGQQQNPYASLFGGGGQQGYGGFGGGMNPMSMFGGGGGYGGFGFGR